MFYAIETYSMTNCSSKHTDIYILSLLLHTLQFKWKKINFSQGNFLLLLFRVCCLKRTFRNEGGKVMVSLTASGEDNQLLCTVRKYLSNESASANVSGTGNGNQSRFLSTQDNFGEELP